MARGNEASPPGFMLNDWREDSVRRMPLELQSALLIMLWKAGRQTLELYPFVVGGAVVAQLLRSSRWMGHLRGAATRWPRAALVAAAGLGVASPLCTYGTVPLVLGLRREGVSVGVLLTFLATSSLMNPQLFILTWGGIGARMALVRLVAVLAFGVLFGTLSMLLPERWVSRPARLELQEERHEPLHARRKLTLRGFLSGTWDELTFVSYYLVIGVVLGVILERLAPVAGIRPLLVGHGWLGVTLAVALAVPLYACGGGTVPLVRSLLDQGMSRGAALAFFVAGPATRVPPLLALAMVLRPAFVACYVAALLLFSALVGFLYDLR